jgi:hypothetical protein
VTHFDPAKKDKPFAIWKSQLKDLALTDVGIRTGLCYCIEGIHSKDIVQA